MVFQMNNAPTIIKYPDIEIMLRKDFYAKFNNFFKNLADEMGLYLFHHNLIQNYREPGHKVSTFGSHEEWSETYWTKFYNNDPIERACNSATQRTGFALTSWRTIDPTSKSIEERTRICKVKDGISLSFKLSNNVIETMSFGWKKFDVESFSLEKIAALSKLVAPLRQHHLSNFNVEVNTKDYKVSSE
jgi:hypothetical protein